MAKPERFQLSNVSLKDIFKDDFIGYLTKINKDLFPVTVVIIKEFEENGKKQAIPLILSHQNNAEVKNKLLHIESPDTDLLDTVVKFIEKNSGNKK